MIVNEMIIVDDGSSGYIRVLRGMGTIPYAIDPGDRLVLSIRANGADPL
jgi:hypothetical protein